MPNSPWHVREREEQDATISVSTAVQDFLASTDVKRLRPNTRSEYQTVLTEFGRWCDEHALIHQRADKSWKAIKANEKHGCIFLHHVNDQVVHSFLDYVKETHKPSRNDATTLSSSLFVLYVKDIKRFLNWCILDEEYCHHVKTLTVQRIKKPKLEHVVKETFSMKQIEALFRVCDKEESEHLRLRDRTILALLLDSGIRATELVTLNIGHVFLDSKDPHVRVFGKGQKWGEVGIGEQARRLLQKYIRQFREPTIEHRHADRIRKVPPREQSQVKRQLVQQEVVFVNRAGKPLTRGGLLQIVERLGEWAEIDIQCSPHIFRHTFARMFMQNGGDIYTLSKLLRHTSVRVTEDYLRSLQQAEARRGAKSVLDNL